MRKILKTHDVSGLELAKGDTVATLNGDLSAKICDLCEEGGATFVRLRPIHMPYSPGVWYAADQVLRLARAKPRPTRPATSARPARKRA